MADMEKIERLKKDFAQKSDAELINEMHQWREFAEMHIAAKLVLQERKNSALKAKEGLETRRFHWFFWPALIAALASIASLAIQIYQAQHNP